VEVVRANPKGAESEIVRVLGPGSFCSERAFLNEAPHACSVRARTAVKVLVLGRNVLTQVSAALAPLHAAIAEALKQRLLDSRP
jgi:CRP-like cAMP-binding protein